MKHFTIESCLPPAVSLSLPVCVFPPGHHTAWRSSSHSPQLGPTNLARGSLDGWGAGAPTQTGKQGPSRGVAVIHKQVVVRTLRVQEKEVQQDPVLGAWCWAVRTEELGSDVDPLLMLPHSPPKNTHSAPRDAGTQR